MSKSKRLRVWWFGHAHLVVLCAAAVAAGLIVGFWQFAFIVVGTELLHQGIHSAANHPGDWRATWWFDKIILRIGSGGSGYALYGIIDSPRGLGLAGCVLLYIAGQALTSSGWHRNAPPHRVEYAGTVLASRWVRPLGITMMLCAVALAWAARP